MKKLYLLFLPIFVLCFFGFAKANIVNAQAATTVTAQNAMPILSQMVSTTANIVSQINTSIQTEESIKSQLAENLAAISAHIGTLTSKPISEMTIAERVQLSQILGSVGVALKSTQDSLRIIQMRRVGYANTLSRLTLVLQGINSILVQIR